MSAVTQQQMVEQVQAARDQMQAQMQASSAHSDTQLASANAQILYLSQTLESVRADQERLRRESEAAFNSFEARTQGRTGGTVNMKSFEGGRFAGGKAESFQAWAKRVRIYCNALSSGMKKAMEAAEASTREVDVRSLGLADPRLAEDLDAKLHDFLSTYVAEEALRIVEGIPDKGFEAWRQLKVRYQPEGFLMDLFRIEGLFSRKPCKLLSQVPAALDVLEKDLKHYAVASGGVLPQDVKIHLLCRLLPESHRTDLERRYRQGERDYQKLFDNIMSFANEHRLMEGRKPTDMDVDSAEQSNDETPRYTAEE